MKADCWERWILLPVRVRRDLGIWKSLTSQLQVYGNSSFRTASRRVWRRDHARRKSHGRWMVTHKLWVPIQAEGVWLALCVGQWWDSILRYNVACRDNACNQMMQTQCPASYTMTCNSVRFCWTLRVLAFRSEKDGLTRKLRLLAWSR